MAQLTKKAAEDRLYGLYLADGHLSKIGKLLEMARNKCVGKVRMSNECLESLDEAHEHSATGTPTLSELVEAISEGKMLFDILYLDGEVVLRVKEKR